MLIFLDAWNSKKLYTSIITVYSLTKEPQQYSNLKIQIVWIMVEFRLLENLVPQLLVIIKWRII